MKILKPLLHLIIFLLHHESKLVFRTRIKFDGQCLKQNKVTFNLKTAVDICIIYETNLLPFKESAYFTLVSSLFGPVKLIKNADFDKDKYSDYGIGFDARKSFCLSDSSEFGKNVITFSVDMSLSGHVDH